MSLANKTFSLRSGLRNDQKAICRIFDRAVLYGAGYRQGEPSDSCRRGGSRNDPLRLVLQLQQMPRENRLKLGLPAITPLMDGLPDMEGAGQGRAMCVASSDHTHPHCLLPDQMPLTRLSFHVGLPVITPMMVGLPDMGRGRTG